MAARVLCRIDRSGRIPANPANRVGTGRQKGQCNEDGTEFNEIVLDHDEVLRKVETDPMKAELSASPQERVSGEKVHVIACGAIAREILAITRLNGLDHVDLACLPAIWHAHPEKIAPGVRAAIDEARAKGAGKIFVAYADCGTGGALDQVLKEAGDVERLTGPHCYSFFAGNEDFAARWDEDLTAFFLTDFLARQFEAFVIEPLGLDRHPELKDIYFSHYTKLIYLSQVEDPALQEKAKAAAAYLGVAYEYRYTGYGDLASELLAAARAS